MTTTNAAPDPLALLAALEATVAAGRHEDACRLLMVLGNVLVGEAFSSPLAPPGYPGDRLLPLVAFCDRYAAAWAALWLDEGLDLARLPILPLMRNQHVVHLLVHGSTAGHLDDAMRTLNARAGGTHTPASLARLAMLWVPGSRFGFRPFDYHANLPQLATAQAVATVAAAVAATPEAHAAREAAIDFLVDGPATPADYAPLGFSNDVGAAWMRCSYASSPRAHRVKPFLNAVVAREVPAAALPSAAVARERPVMLVPLDAFGADHAMYRCYAAVLAACRPRFRLVALVRAGTLDAESARLFDEVLDADAVAPAAGEGVYAPIVRLAASCSADIVFYPSVGMRKLTVALAQRRLAPVQVMTLGHPATSASPVIDAVVTEAQWVVDPAAYTERVVTVPRGTLQFALPRQAVAAVRPAEDGVVRVAVPSVAQKWTWPFLQGLQQAAARSRVPLEFHLFSGLAGFAYAAAVRAVRETLPQAVVHPALPYNDYLAQLARCDLQAGTFPFGGTNSIIDSLLCGLPVVCLAPRDARGAQDADFLARAGLPDWLVAPDEATWVDTLLRVAEDAGLRHDLRARLADRSRVEAVFLAAGQPGKFAEALQGLLARGGADTAR